MKRNTKLLITFKKLANHSKHTEVSVFTQQGKWGVGEKKQGVLSFFSPEGL